MSSGNTVSSRPAIFLPKTASLTALTYAPTRLLIGLGFIQSPKISFAGITLPAHGSTDAVDLLSGSFTGNRPQTPDQIVHAGLEHGEATTGLVLIAKVGIGDLPVALRTFSVGTQYGNLFTGFGKLGQQLRLVLEIHGKNYVGSCGHFCSEQLGAVVIEWEFQIPGRDLRPGMGFLSGRGMHASRTHGDSFLTVLHQRALEHEFRHRAAHDVAEAYKDKGARTERDQALVRMANSRSVQHAQPSVNSSRVWSQATININLLEQTFRQQRAQDSFQCRP